MKSNLPHLWRAGESGNPGGRTAYSGVSRALRQQLQSLIPESMCGQLRDEHPELIDVWSDRPTWEQYLAFVMIKRAAVKADVLAFKELLDRAEGKPAQVVVTVTEPLSEKTDEELAEELRALEG